MRRALVHQAWPILTALPTSPVDGQECYFQVSDLEAGATTVAGLWHLRYRAASTSPYKWEFAGGESMFRELDAGVGGGASSTWVGQDGPTLTVPLAGVYEVGMGCRMVAAGTTAFIWQAGLSVNNATPTDILYAASGNQGGGTTAAQPSREMVRTYAKSDVLTFWYQVVQLAATFDLRYLRLRPRRVG